MPLRGPRVRLRPFGPRDAEAIARRLNDREVWLNLTDQIAHPYTRAHAEVWIEHCRSQTPTCHFAIDRDGEAIGEAIGAAGVDRLGDLARLIREVGYWLGRDCWGRVGHLRARRREGRPRRRQPAVRALALACSRDGAVRGRPRRRPASAAKQRAQRGEAERSQPG